MSGRTIEVNAAETHLHGEPRDYARSLFERVDLQMILAGSHTEGADEVQLTQFKVRDESAQYLPFQQFNDRADVQL